MSLCGRFIVPYFYLITCFYSSQNKSNYPSARLHHATAVHAAPPHCAIFVNLTLPSPNTLAPLCDSVPPPQWVPGTHQSVRIPSIAGFKLLLEPCLVEERAKEQSLSVSSAEFDGMPERKQKF